jgi:PAS domain-containing protein
VRSISGPALVYLKHREGRGIPVEIVVSPVYDDTGQVLGAVLVFQDMSGVIEKERTLLIKSQKLQTVLESIREGVLFIDTDGRVSVYNSALCELFSLRGEDLRGIEVFSLPDSHPLKHGIFRTDRAFRGPYCWELNRCPENRADCPEHGERYCRCWIFSLYRSASPPVPTCIDCEAYARVKKFLEEPKELVRGEKTLSVSSSFVEMRATNEIWEVIVFRDVTAEKTDAVVKFAAGAAHELRQPMQVILSALSMMRSEAPPAGTTATCIGIIRESCLRMNRVLKKLGDISQYRVKPYTELKDILDLDKSSEAR